MTVPPIPKGAKRVLGLVEALPRTCLPQPSLVLGAALSTTVKGLVVLSFLLAAPAAYGQPVDVNGTVTDSTSGATLPGVSIVVKGTNVGTATGADGNYSLEAPSAQDTLVFSFVGYRSKQVPISGRSTVNVQLAGATVRSEEVVVVGYGAVKQENVTGAVSQLSAEKIENRPVSRVEQTLTGQMAGVQTRQTSGQPGSPLEVRVRGGSSISASNEPLYVVDGVPVDDLGKLNPSDIASIEVLKDAASAAIYGSRGANGVVLVSTKSGEANQTRFHFSSYYGRQTLETKVDLLSGQEWIDIYMEKQDSAWVQLGRQQGMDYKASDPISYRREQLGVERNSTYIPDPRWVNDDPNDLAFIDWQDEFYNPAGMASYQLSASGGAESLNYYLSGGYLDQEGIAYGTSYDRLTLRAKLDAQLSERVSMGLNIAPSMSWSRGGNVDGKDQQAQSVLDIVPVAEPDVGINTGIGNNETYYWGGSAVSPVMFQELSDREVQEKGLASQLRLDIDLLESLTAEVRGSWNSNTYERSAYYPTSISGEQAAEEGERSSGQYRTINSDQYLEQVTLTYDNDLGDHSLQVLAGQSVEYFKEDASYQSHSQFANDRLRVINDGSSTVNSSETTALEHSLVSFFGRVIYDYNDRYLATVSFRRDASSRFGSGNKWGNFPSLSLGWVASEEAFLQSQDWLSTLKLRASVGYTGNNSIPNYAYYGGIGVDNYSFGNSLRAGYAPSALSNPDLGWEQTRSVDVGLDLGLLQDRINFTVDYYNKVTEDLLLEVPVAQATGFSSGLQNVGSVMNEGVEFSLRGAVGSSTFSWEPSANLSFNRNEVLSLGPGDTPIYTGFSGQTAIIKVGEPLLSYYLYDAIGIYETREELENNPTQDNSVLGGVRYRDVNGDGTINADDRTIVGQRNPTYTWGFSNTFRYRNFDLSVLVQGQGGNEINGMIGRAIDRPGMCACANRLGYWRNRYKSPENAGNGKVPAINGTTGFTYDTRWLYDASYIRLRNVTLGYQLPDDLFPLVTGARIYVSGENLFLHDHYYGGYSPEAQNIGSGEDYGGYPTARTYTVGLDFSF